MGKWGIGGLSLSFLAARDAKTTFGMKGLAGVSPKVTEAGRNVGSACRSLGTPSPPKRGSHMRCLKDNHLFGTPPIFFETDP